MPSRTGFLLVRPLRHWHNHVFGAFCLLLQSFSLACVLLLKVQTWLPVEAEADPVLRQLRSSISLDVRPCRGLALVAVRAAGLIPPPVHNIRLPFEPPSLVHRAQSQSTASPHPSRIVWAATWNEVASRGPSRSRADLMIVSTTSRSTRCAGGREGALGSYRWWVGPSRWPAGEEVRRDSRSGQCRELHSALTYSAALHPR